MKSFFFFFFLQFIIIFYWIIFFWKYIKSIFFDPVHGAVFCAITHAYFLSGKDSLSQVCAATQLQTFTNMPELLYFSFPHFYTNKPHIKNNTKPNNV